MDRGIGDDGSINDLPWTAVFDPVANARALSAIQAEGFRAATRLVDRFVTIAETAGNGAASSSESASTEDVVSNSAPNSNVDVIVSSWWSLFGRWLRSMPAANPGSNGSAHFELGDDNTNGLVQLNADGTGCTSTEIWLHNSGAEDLADVRLRCSELLAHDGHVIGSAQVSLTPDCVPMPARSSRGVTVEDRCRSGGSRGALPRHTARRGSSRSVAAGRPDAASAGLMTSTADRADLIAAVEDRLRDVARIVRRSMLDAMPDGEPAQWLYGPMREYPSRPGKALRPACACRRDARSAEAPTILLGIAVAIELLHNAFLVHDDVADGSEMRRGRPTLAATYGMAAALNAGDGLAVVAGQVLRRATRRLDRDLADLVWAEFDTMAMRTLEGQATEVGWQLDDVEDLGPEDYLEPDHAQDVLVHHHSSTAGRCDRRVRAGPPSWVRWCASDFTSARRSRFATTCSISLGMNGCTARRFSAISTRASARCR